LLTAILWPLHNAFFRILNLISGPVIFLSVLASVYEVGNMATLGDMWKKMVARFVGFSFLITILSAFACVPVYSLEMNQVFLSDSEFSSILDLILNIVPNDVVTPILTGASPSIILLALVFAAALLIMGKQSTAVTAVITQLNSIMLMIMEWVNSLVAFFVIIMVLTHLWSGSLMILIGIWQPILAALVICVLILLFVAISICIREKVSLVLLFKKLRPSFIISFKTASTSESLGENVTCCEKKLGINHLITNFGIPLGTAIYMPGLSVAFLVVICYMAKQYDVVVTPMWIIMAIILTTILAIATPPIAGIGLMGHVALFAQLGIPSEALAVAMIADILIGFIASPFNQMLLQFELLSEASKMKLLNKDILKNKKAV